MGLLSPFLARIIGIVVAWLAGHLANRYHIFLSSDQQTQIADLILNVIGGFLTVYVVSHKWLDKYINPGDAASSHLAASEKVEAQALKDDPSGVSR